MELRSVSEMRVGDRRDAGPTQEPAGTPGDIRPFEGVGRNGSNLNCDLLAQPERPEHQFFHRCHRDAVGRRARAVADEDGRVERVGGDQAVAPLHDVRIERGQIEDRAEAEFLLQEPRRGVQFGNAELRPGIGPTIAIGILAEL